MKRLCILTMLLAGCSGNGACTFPADGVATIPTSCVGDSGGAVLAVDAESFVAAAVTSGGYELVRLDRRRGTSRTLTANLYPGAYAALPVVIDAGDVFFGRCVDQTDCAIASVPSMADGTTRIIAATSSPVKAIAVDSTSVYWLDDGVWSAPRGGGAPSHLMAGPAFGLAVDGTGVYTTAMQGLVRVPFDGSVPQLIDSAGGEPIVARDGAVYWMDAGSMQSVDCAALDGSINSWSPTTGPQRLANNIVGVGGFAVGKSVAWTATQIAATPGSCVRSSDGAVFEIINGEAAAISNNYFSSLVSDGANVYSVLGQQIWQVPLR